METKIRPTQDHQLSPSPMTPSGGTRLQPRRRRGRSNTARNKHLPGRKNARTHARTDADGPTDGNGGREETKATATGDPLPHFSPVQSLSGGPAQQRCGWDGCRHAQLGLRDESQGRREGRRERQPAPRRLRKARMSRHRRLSVSVCLSSRSRVELELAHLVRQSVRPWGQPRHRRAAG